MNSIETIREKVSRAALCEQLAEECSELAQAALKLARILRKENPTPLTKAEVLSRMAEEIVDVLVCLEVLGYRDDLYEAWSMDKKLERWVNRLEKLSEKR